MKLNIEEFLIELMKKDVAVSINGGKIEITASEGFYDSEEFYILKKNKNEIIDFIGDKINNNYFSIDPIEKKEYIPLSSAQKRMFFLQQMSIDSTAYNMQGSHDFGLQIDKTKVKSIFTKLINRHENLRTSFEMINDIPMQRIHNFDDIKFNIDYFKLEGENINEDIIEVFNKFVRPFNLSTAPLLRVAYIEVKGRKIVLIDMHHIISDGTSHSILTQDFMKLYHEEKLPYLRLQYKDYSEFHNRKEERDEIKSQKAYWINKLKGELPILNLPIDYLRPSMKNYEGSTASFILNEKEVNILKNVIRQMNSTLYMFLLSVYSLLLSKICNQEDIIVGIPIAARNHDDFQDIVGMFVNMLPIRIYPKNNKMFKEFLFELKTDCLEAFENQLYQFDDLVNDLNIERDTSRNPIFDVVFNYFHENDIVNRNNENYDDNLFEYKKNTSIFDLKLTGIEYSNNIHFVFDYSTKLFNHETVNRFIDYFKKIISTLILDFDMHLSEIEILSKIERDKLIYEFNDTAADYPKDKTIHQLFEEQVDNNSENIALEFDGESISYMDLNNKSNQIAGILQSKGIKYNNIVGLLSERTPDAIACIMGVLKSGAAYLPIEPEFSRLRKKYIISDSNIFLLIIQKKIYEKERKLFDEFSNLEIIIIEDTELLDNNYIHDNTINNQENLAYIIYTSGSTGNPKGTLIKHQNVVNYLWWASKNYVKNEKVSFPLYTSFSFDLTVTSLFVPLITGNKILIYKDKVNDLLINDVIDDNKVDIIKLTPAHLKVIKEKKIMSSKIKRFIVGGEELKTDLAKDIYNLFGNNIEIFNEYGPTEATVGCMIHLYDENNDVARSVPIGIPADNVQNYILDVNNKVLSTGVIGELCISGDGIAKGYLNSTKMTNEKFIVNPFISGTKLYKTGDLARMLPIGLIEYLGRNDDQIKIRGYRVELNEVEHTIKQIINTKKTKKIEKVYDKNLKKMCSICLRTPSHTNFSIDKKGVCNVCNDYFNHKKEIDQYFKNEKDFELLIEKESKNNNNKYDCLLLFSGGKDSTYVLYKLVEMGLRVLTFTFDNGYISDGAFENIKKTTKKIGVENIVISSDKMNDIFIESLKLDHNVCNGCWNALNTIGAKLANENDINMIVSGLSRGQIVEMRLEGLFQANTYDEKDIENELINFRKIFHSKKNAYTKILGVEIAENIVENMLFIDFFRYFNTPIEDIQNYLLDKGWIKPKDTGFCSSNCLINDVGIYIHLKDLGYHSYSIQTSWDIRLNQHTRDNAIKEVDFKGNIDEVDRILKDLGYYNYLNIDDIIVINRKDKDNDQYLCAYFVSNNTIDVSELKKYLSKKISDYMLPLYFVRLDKIPLTNNGKIDRKALPVPEIVAGEDYVAPNNEIEERLLSIWSEVLGIEKENISTNSNFFEIGGNSLKIVNLNSRIKKLFNKDLKIVSLFQNSTIETLSKLISGEKQNQEVSNEVIDQSASLMHNNGNKNNDIAVIGMSLKAPKSKNIEEFWQNLKEGVETSTFFSEEEFLAAGIDEDLVKNPNYVRMNLFIDDKENFDSGFFKYLPDEAKAMDPQTRMFHEVVWSALEDAGYIPSKYNGLIGLFAGSGENLNWQVNALTSSSSIDSFSKSNLCSQNFMNTLISYKLNLKGPSKFINTACSTSLVAIHDATRALINGDCNIALAGGVSLKREKISGYLYQEGMIFSSDGHCRSFDSKASGAIFGEGAGVVVLKRLDEAIEDKDNIIAVIKGSAINNDGFRKVGYTAPSVDGQSECIRMAYKMAGVEPSSISYVETHGTATKLGDPIEIEALTQAFGKSDRKYCAIGSVKTNIGHLDTAAGVAGFIKTVLSLKHKQIPASLNFQSPNPEINFVESPFYVNSEFKDWNYVDGPLRAGVSSFGIGGTNAHVVLEEAPTFKTLSESREYQIICLSAKTSNALNDISENLKGFLEKNEKINLANMSWTLQKGRDSFNHRKMFVCDSIENAIYILSDKHSKSIKTFVSKKNNKIVFMFPGQGSQYIDMGRELYEKNDIFREDVDKCFEIVKRISGKNLKDIIYPSFPKESDNKKINNTENTQPILFIFEYALSKLLLNFGITPDYMTGHSMGEYTAACLSGVFSLEDAIKIVIERGRLIQSLPKGSMLSVALPEDQLKPLLNKKINIATINTEGMCVVSGEDEAISEFEILLNEKGYTSQKVHISHAFHSQMMDPILENFIEVLKNISFSSPKIPFISNLSGNYITDIEAKSPDYWRKHLRETVQFSKGVTTLLKEKDVLFIEVGPGKTLSTFIRQNEDFTSNHKIIITVRHPKETVSDLSYFLNSLGKLWLYGLDPDWDKFYKGEQRRRISLPTYPFEKIKYPLGDDMAKVISKKIFESEITKKEDIADWFYIPSWKRSFTILLNEQKIKGSINLIFTSEFDLSRRFVDILKDRAQNIILVYPGSKYEKISETEYSINPQNENDYKLLFKRLSDKLQITIRVFHLWTLTNDLNEQLTIKKVKNSQYNGYYSLLNIAKELGGICFIDECEINVITNNLHEVFNNELISPEKGTILGAVKTIPKEYLNIRCRNIDIELDFEQNPTEIIEEVYNELNNNYKDNIVAYRNHTRWIPVIENVKLADVDLITKESISKPVYLITGGLGGMGFAFAKRLLKTENADIILTGRKPVDHNKHQELKQEGGNVSYLQVDITDLTKMNKLLKEEEQRFGSINRIIHTAGIADYAGIIHNRSNKDSEEIFMSKIYGTLVLGEIAKVRNIDYFLICSSIASVEFPFGQVGYSAANIFEDNFAKYFSKTNNIPTISIGWDTWQEVGMAVDAVNKKTSNYNEQKQILQYGITPNEGFDVLNRAIKYDISYLVVSTRDLNILNSKEKQDILKNEEMSDASDNGTINHELPELSFERQELSTKYTEPNSKTEIKLCKIWQDYFGIKRIGINDDFFELGGDSLKAINLLNMIHKTLDVKLPISEIFKYPTIEGMAEFIEMMNLANKKRLEKNEKKEDSEKFEI